MQTKIFGGFFLCPAPLDRDNLPHRLVLTVMNGDLSRLRVYRGRNLIASLISVRFLRVGKKKSNHNSRLQLKAREAPATLFSKGMPGG